MAHSLDEVEQFVGIASALLVNMGTLESSWVAAKKLAAKQVCWEERAASLSVAGYTCSLRARRAARWCHTS